MADDGSGSGASAVYYTLDGTDPRASGTRVLYAAPFTVSATAVVRFSAIDNLRLVELPSSQTITINDVTPPSQPTLTARPPHAPPGRR